MTNSQYKFVDLVDSNNLHGEVENIWNSKGVQAYEGFKAFYKLQFVTENRLLKVYFNTNGDYDDVKVSVQLGNDVELVNLKIYLLKKKLTFLYENFVFKGHYTQSNLQW